MEFGRITTNQLSCNRFKLNSILFLFFHFGTITAGGPHLQGVRGYLPRTAALTPARKPDRLIPQSNKFCFAFKSFTITVLRSFK